jgi:hypothetical protein
VRICRSFTPQRLSCQYDNNDAPQMHHVSSCVFRIPMLREVVRKEKQRENESIKE